MDVLVSGQLHVGSCRLNACNPRPPPRCMSSSGAFASTSSVSLSRARPQRRPTHCAAKKSKKKRRSESFDERPAEPEPEVLTEEDLDNEFAEQSGAADTSYEVYEEETARAPQQYQQTQAVAPPAPVASTSGSSDAIKLGGLAVGAVALIAAVAFGLKRFANRKLPEVEKVSVQGPLPVSWLVTCCMLCACVGVTACKVSCSTEIGLCVWHMMWLRSIHPKHCCHAAEPHSQAASTRSNDTTWGVYGHTPKPAIC